MECNKDEAIRAKNIAEKKMFNDDFQGARKLLVKAQNLFPSLENIYQLLTVCDVHCSAQNNLLGSEKDWYSVLQIEKLADEATIKKQYRKLALILHPDKNKYPGAEAAFKLIGEANMVLSDKGKRSLYDIKCRVSVRTAVPKPPSNHANPENSHVSQSKTQTSNASPHQFNDCNQHKPSVCSSEETFWTACPFCDTKFHYYRISLSRSLRCQNCSKPFIAYEIANQRPTIYRETNAGSKGTTFVSNGAPTASVSKKISEKTSQMGAKISIEVSQQKFSSVDNSSEKKSSHTKTGTQAATKAAHGLMNKVRKTHVTTKADDVKVGRPKVDLTKAKQSGNSRNKNKNKKRKYDVKSSESFDTMSISDSEATVYENTSSVHSGTPSRRSNDTNCRRSSRLKKNVLCNDNAYDDLMSSEKKSRHGKEKQKEPSNKLNESGVNIDETKRNKSEFDEGSLKYSSTEAEPRAKNLFRSNGTRSDVGSTSTTVPETYECPEPEFSDFDKDKYESRLSVGQIWACYDTIDGMPRFYAHIKKVCSPEFKLRFTWLEAVPQSQDETDWENKGLPVGCGQFVQGVTDETSDLLTFSHQIHFVKGLGRGSYIIYPRRGEIWALFKDWDVKWSSDLENHKRYVFIIVEILSDFRDDTSGIKVGYLTKLEGFVSLFDRTRGAAAELLILSKDLLRFSHRIPSCRMAGTEREGVPQGSYELDPAALPTDPSECWQPEGVETQETNVQVTGSSTKFVDEKVMSTNGFQNAGTSKIFVDFRGMEYAKKQVEKPQQSSRESNSKKKSSAHVTSSPGLSEKGTAKHSGNSFGCATPCKRKASSGQGNEEIHLATCKSPDVRRSSFGVKVSEEIFYDFDLDKSEGKFQPGQIWALYSRMDKLPNHYGQIKKIETSPFKLHVAFLEPCKFKQPVCCGTFKIQNGKPKILLPSSFSHLMNVESTSKPKIEIYPNGGEIWAIYKNWNSDLSCPDFGNCEFDIVKIVTNDDSGTKLLCLERLRGFNSVFRARRGPNSSTANVMIPRGDLSRFSHQIPAFQLTGEKDGSLRGCWQLDAVALPGHMLRKAERHT